MPFRSLPRFAGFVLPLLMASALSAQTIPNPSFEANGDFATAPGYAANNGGVITGWTMSDPAFIGINSINGPFYNNGALPDGTHVAFLQSTGGTTSLSNNITGLIPGMPYLVSFRANSRASYSAPGSTWSLNGGAFVAFTAWPTVNSEGVFANPFYTNSALFVATSTTAALVIRNQSSSDATVVVDDFSIAPNPPFITLAATGVSNTVATLNGVVNPSGLNTTAWFEWGPYPDNNSQVTAPTALGNGTTSLAVSNALSGLTPGVIYHCCVVVSNAAGIARGSDVRFGSPVIAPNGTAPPTNECHSAFTNFGVTVTSPPLALAGGVEHSLALKSDGTVAAWGGNTYGETNIPVGLSSVVAIAGGGYHNMALKRDGTVVAWGDSNFGVSTVPVGLSNVVAIAGGDHHNLALKSDGTVVAWGYNSDGQTNIPVGLSNVVAIAAGYYHNLALKNDGTVVAWGAAYGTNIPVGLSNVVAVAGGFYFSLALKSDGTVVAWGDYGQTNIPVGLSNVVAIAGGGNHGLALKSDGAVVAWGDNTYGQTNIPVGLSNVVAIAAGGFHSLALKSDGTVVAWGYNYSGQTNIPVGLSSLALTGSSGVNMNSPGSYPVTYTSTNFLGGVATCVLTVVVSDTLAPVITILGANPLTNLLNAPLVDPGATNWDACGGSVAMTTNSGVNISMPGTYIIAYTATDNSGNSATNSRVVVVVGPPVISGLTAAVIATNGVNGNRTVSFAAFVNPNGLSTMVNFLYGLTTAYGGTTTISGVPASFIGSNVTASVDLSAGLTYHWQVVATNSDWNSRSPDQTFTVGTGGIPGDLDGDGIVDQSEFNAVLSNYLAASPYLLITNTAGLGQSNVTFALTNSLAGAFTVQFSTNQSTWQDLGPATPSYSFTDTNAPNTPQRFYRLKYP